jgi:hypothetical protein
MVAEVEFTRTAPMADDDGWVLTRVEKEGLYGWLKAVEVLAWAPS